MNDKSEKIVAYKAFKNDMKCRDFQYEVGKEYEEKGNISLCKNGFHACEMPLDVFNYYPLIDDNGKMSKFAEVEQSGEIKTDGDKKASSKISIKAMLSFADLFKAEFELIKDKVSKSVNLQATTGNYANSSTTGEQAHSSTTGYKAHSSTTGDEAHSSTTGYYAHSSTTGYKAHSSTTGYKAHSSTTGYKAHSSTTGNYAHSSTTGNYANSSTTGEQAHSSTTGYKAHSSTTGDEAHSSTTGYNAHSSTTGNYAHSSTTGYKAHSSTTGYNAHSSTTGYNAHSSTTGDEAISCSLGLYGKAKASKGWIVIVDWQEKEDGTYGIKKIYSAKVGQKIKGTKIEPETSYWFDDGKLKSEKKNNNG